MCMFSFDRQNYPRAMPIQVERTRIFARGLADGMQILVYSMRYRSQVDMAMVLPLPTPSAPAEDSIAFIDLSEYETFFDDMERGFPKGLEIFEGLTLSADGARTTNRPILVVHEVGSFEASFVPTQADFVRLDPRFRLPKGILDQLPVYRDYAFAVFKLKPGDRKTHPMAIRFPRRDRSEIFFPTMHVHDGTIRKTAQFDHSLYSQGGDTESSRWATSFAWDQRKWTELGPEDQERLLPDKVWEFRRMFRNIDAKRARQLAIEADFDVKVPAAARNFMDIARTRGTVDKDALVAKLTLYGSLPNADTRLLESASS